MAALALVWDLIARDGASPTFNKVAVSADRAAVATERAGAAGAGFGKKMVAALGAVAAIDIGAHMISEAAKFQRAMLLIQTQAGASAAEVKSMSKAVLAMAGSVGTAPEKLATSLYHIESVGLHGAKALDVLRVAAEGAKVGNGDLEQTTNALTSSVASGIPGVKNMTQAMGMLNAIVGTGDMKLSDLNEALSGGILTVVKGYGLSLKDVGAALATFGDNNIRGADAATMLRMAVQAMAVPAKGGKDALDKLGLSTTTLATDMQTGGLNKAILDLKAHLDKAGVSSVQVGAILTQVFGKRAGPGLAVLIGQVDRLETKYGALSEGAKRFGSDWDATRHTASFALQAIGAQIEAAGITLGTKLLPAVTDVATWLGTNVPAAFHTLNDILGPTVHLIGGALVDALHSTGTALGIVTTGLAAVGGFLKDNKGVVTGFATAVAAMWAAFKLYTIAAVAIKAISSGLQTLALKAMYAGDAIAAGLGPVGIAIAALGVMIGGAVMRSNDHAAAIQREKDEISSLTDAIKQDSGALGDNSREVVKNALAASGANDAARSLGVNLKTLTDAAIGNGAALKAIHAELPGMASAMRVYNGATDDERKVLDKSTDSQTKKIVALAKVGNALGDNNGAVAKATQAAKDNVAADGKSVAVKGKLAAATNQVTKMLQWNIDAHGRLSQTMVKSGSSADNTTAALQRQTVASGLLKNALDALNGVNTSVEQTQDALSISLGNLANKSSLFTDANGHMSTSLKQSTVAGATNRAMLAGIIGQAKDAAQAVADHARAQGHLLPTALKIGNAALKANEDKIRAAATAAGFNKGETDKLIGSLGILAKIKAVPKVDLFTNPAAAKADAIQAKIDRIKQNHEPGITANTYEAVALINDLQRRLDNLHDKTVNITARYNGTANTVKASAAGSASWTADGKLPRNSVSTVGERGWEAAITDGSGRTQIFSHSDSKRMFAASGLAVPGYAGGTGKPDVYTLDGSTTEYGTRRGAMNAARRELKAELNLGVKINTKDLTNLNKIIHGTVDQAKAWFTKLSDHLKGLPGFAKYMVGSGKNRETLSSWLKDEDKKLNSAIGAANATAAKLKAVRDKMAQLRDGVKSAVTGFFDVTQAGANPVTGRISGAGMLAQQRQALLQIKKFNADLHRLESRHLNKAYLMELASQGPSVVPQLDALLAMSPRQFSAFNRNEALINRYGASAGRGVSNTVYGAQERSLAVLETSQRQAAKDIIKEIRHELVPAVKKLEHQPINVYLDGKKIAEATRKSDKQTARR